MYASSVIIFWRIGRYGLHIAWSSRGGNMEMHRLGKFFVAVLIAAGLVCAAIPVSADSKQGCQKACVKTEQKCVQTEKKCVRTKNECAQVGTKCVATESRCISKDYKTGRCLSSQEVCTQKQEYCAQYRQACAEYQEVCAKKQESCAQYQEVCPSTATVKGSAPLVQKPKGKMSCNECVVQRSRCTTGCGNINNLIDQSNCINKCNGAYSCVIGYDCQQ